MPKYLELLAAGGSDAPAPAARPGSGVDVNDPGFWELGLRLLGDMVTEAESLAAELGLTGALSGPRHTLPQPQSQREGGTLRSPCLLVSLSPCLIIRRGRAALMKRLSFPLLFLLGGLGIADHPPAGNDGPATLIADLGEHTTTRFRHRTGRRSGSSTRD